MEETEIAIETLFLNVDSGFYSEGFRAKRESKDIANVDFNKRRGNKDHDLLLDKKRYKEKKGVLLNAQMLGLTVLDHC